MCNWEQAWLTYELIENQKDKKYFESVYTQQNGVLVESALREIKTAAEKLFSITVRRGENREEAGLILELNPALNLGKEGYQITEEEDRIYIRAAKENGLLYGTFRLLLMVSSGKEITGVFIRVLTSQKVKMVYKLGNKE